MIEDIIDTGGSMEQVVEALLARGALPEIHILATHGVLSPPATERLSHPAIKEVVVTNTIAIPPERNLPKLRSLSVAPVFGDAIRRIHQNISVSVLFL